MKVIMIGTMAMRQCDDDDVDDDGDGNSENDGEDDKQFLFFSSTYSYQ